VVEGRIPVKRKARDLELGLAVVMALQGGTTPGNAFWDLSKLYDQDELLVELRRQAGKGAFRSVILDGLCQDHDRMMKLIKTYPLETVEAFPTSKKLWRFCNPYTIGREKLGEGIGQLMWARKEGYRGVFVTQQMRRDCWTVLMSYHYGVVNDVTKLVSVLTGFPYQERAADCFGTVKASQEGKSLDEALKELAMRIAGRDTYKVLPVTQIQRNG